MKQKSNKRLTDQLSTKKAHMYSEHRRRGEPHQSKHETMTIKSQMKLQTKPWTPPAPTTNSSLYLHPQLPYQYCIPYSFHFLGIVGGCLSVCVGTVKNSEDSTRFNLLLPQFRWESNTGTLSAGWIGEIKWMSELRSTCEVKFCVWTKMSYSHKVVSTMI